MLLKHKNITFVSNTNLFEYLGSILRHALSGGSNHPIDKVFVLYGMSDLRNTLDFWNVHGIMNTSGLLQSK